MAGSTTYQELTILCQLSAGDFELHESIASLGKSALVYYHAFLQMHETATGRCVVPVWLPDTVGDDQRRP
jgi:hypothetical protein